MGLWIEVADGASSDGPKKPYFWHTESGATSWTKPNGEEVCWVAQKAENGTMYYWHKLTRETRWSVPELRSHAATTRASASTGPAPASSGRPVDGWIFPLLHRGSSVREPKRGAVPGQESDSAAGTAAANPQDANAVEGRGGGDQDGAAWVEVHLESGGSAYFWNMHNSCTITSLPPNMRATWRAFVTPDGHPYFVHVDTKTTTWEVPGVPKDSREETLRDFTEFDTRWIDVGAAVMLRALTDERYNDQIAQVTGYQYGRVIVQLPDCTGGTMLAVQPRNLKPLPNGTIIEFRGLSQTSLNGQIGTVVEPMEPEKECRLHVQVRDTSVKIVKPVKVMARSRLWDINMGNSHAWLQWRKEQCCLFIDSGGQHCKYSLHLPLNFATTQQAKRTKGITQWPLIVYLHGKGGGSFFTHSKKTIRSNGLQHAAAHFVVVSPHCDWSWRDTPKPWVNELVSTLRRAAWIDHNRIYLTGCSMGGMSTWEVGAARPDIYAAIAPVAGHHQDTHEPMLAKSLRHMPVLAVHSEHDETCPLHLEEPLWGLLKAQGNAKLQLSVAPFIDHTSMFEKAYCDDTTLYDWLLMWTRQA